MTIFEQHLTSRSDRLIDGLKAEYGSIIAGQMIEAEMLDFVWEARVAERYLGQQIEAFDEDGEDRSRLIVLSHFDGSW